MNWESVGKWLRRTFCDGPYERLDCYDLPSWRKRCKVLW